MKPRIRIHAGKLKAAFQSFSAQDKQAILEKTVRTDAMGFVRDVVAITPPGSQGAPLVSGSKGEKAVAQGMQKVKMDAKRLFVPMASTILTQAARRSQSGENVRLWVDQDGTLVGCPRVYFQPSATVDQLRDHHRAAFIRGRVRAKRVEMQKEGRWALFRAPVVPKAVFDAFVAYQQGKVGMLAGAWAEAAKKLKVRMPAIAKRHASGACQILIGADSYRVRMTNTVPYATNADLKRRAVSVLDSEKRRRRLQNRIRAEITAVLKRRLK
jgi:hypothetical protein